MGVREEAKRNITQKCLLVAWWFSVSASSITRAVKALLQMLTDAFLQKKQMEISLCCSCFSVVAHANFWII